MNDGIKICTYPDDEVGSITVVLLWHDEGESWYNSGIVVNEVNPVIAFQKALGRAIEAGWWHPD
jgi:hypothetical protein